MKKQVIDILTSFRQAKKFAEIGNVAIARGAIEYGVEGVFSYPGTPSTEISEVFNQVSSFQNRAENKEAFPEQTAHPIYFEYSINEKIALEKAIAYAVGNRSAMCVMKNVGMNVASDALMSITYQTICAPLVIVICDDPGCHSSSNEQDSRYWGKLASVPVFSPASPEEALKQVKSAFELSERLKIPVILRSSTRVSHTRGMVFYGKISDKMNEGHFDRLPEHINIPAKTALAHAKLLDKLESLCFIEYWAKHNYLSESPNAKWGIVSSGVSSLYVSEILNRSSQKNNYTSLDLGLINPFPVEQALEFLHRGFEKILVVEELEPFVENEFRILAQENNIKQVIFGKSFSTLSYTGEYSLDSVEKALIDFSEDLSLKNPNIPLTESNDLVANLPARPPALCAGCPHRATFYALKLAVPREESDVILCGDIGCNGLGALPPLKMIDTINHMGMSISMAQGLSQALEKESKKGKTVAMLGDGTFFHSGLTSLVNAVYTKANILVIIFDNRTIGMTGHQDHPGATHLNRYHQIDLLPLVQGMGVDYADSIYPFNLKDTYQKFNRAMEVEGVSVLVSKAPCIFLPEFKEGAPVRQKIVVDHSKCNTCANHEDLSIACSRCYSPLSNLSRARLKMLAQEHVPAEEQLCPANICNHGFFNSIVEGHYDQAVNIVRDKMLFSRTCGAICHRPCELFSDASTVVPIKKLKHFVSSIDSCFTDFSPAKKRVSEATPKGKHVAIIGAGPAGLSAAYDLIREGYEVTVFEKEETPGGMVKHIIPYFRMDKNGFDQEVGILAELGVDFQYNKQLGRDFSLTDLDAQYDAVILAIGLWKAKKLPLTENLSKTHNTDALSFLKDVNAGIASAEARDYLIIGGGNSALDAARAAKRLNAENKVELICIEPREYMPAFAEEIKHALDEGVILLNEVELAEVQLADSGLNLHIRSLIDSSIQVMNKDVIITAIGQQMESEHLCGLNRYADPLNGLLHAESETGFTTYRNVFVAGDISHGNHQSVIGAIASGKKAATGVRGFLETYPYPYEGQKALDRLNQSGGSYKIPVIQSGEMQELLDEMKKIDFYQACAKCNHCIDNFGCPAMIKVNGKIEIDYQKCTNCGLCVDVCPNNAISFVEEKI